MCAVAHSVISPLVARIGLSRGEQEGYLKEITEREWDIPGSPRTSVARSTVLRWLALYQRSSARVESLEPQPRKDRGTSRALEDELEKALLVLQKANPGVSLPVLLKLAHSRNICRADNTPSKDSLYRLFKRNGLDKELRRFSAASGYRHKQPGAQTPAPGTGVGGYRFGHG